MENMLWFVWEKWGVAIPGCCPFSTISTVWLVGELSKPNSGAESFYPRKCHQLLYKVTAGAALVLSSASRPYEDASVRRSRAAARPWQRAASAEAARQITLGLSSLEPITRAGLSKNTSDKASAAGFNMPGSASPSATDVASARSRCSLAASEHAADK